MLRSLAAEPPPWLLGFMWAITRHIFGVGLQPWHNATEFRRALFQHLGDFHNLSILDCLDGYYRSPPIRANISPNLSVPPEPSGGFPIRHQITDIVKIGPSGQRISRFELIRNGFNFLSTLDYRYRHSQFGFYHFGGCSWIKRKATIHVTVREPWWELDAIARSSPKS